MKIPFFGPHKTFRRPFFAHNRIEICLIISFSILVACSPANEAPIRIGTNDWPGYEPLYLAQNLGLYDDSSIRLVELNNASDVLHAMRTGNLEAAALTLDEVLSLIQDGFELSVILAMDVSAGADVLLAKPEIATLADLQGKQVAVEYSGVGAIMLDAALEAAGLTAADIVIVACTVDKHETCYLSVDAVVTFEPVKTRLMARGAQILFDSSLIPGRIVDVLVVHKELTESHPSQLRLLLAGYFQALEHLQTQADDAARRMAQRLRISPEEVLTSFDGLSIPGLAGNKSLLGDGQESLQTTANYLVRIMLEKNFLRNTIVIENLTDDSFLPD